jgi:hypothetical protein
MNHVLIQSIGALESVGKIRVDGVLCDRVRTASGSDRIMRYT